MSTHLDEVLKALTKLPAKERMQIEQDALKATQHLIWVPNPGPQTEAYFSEADEIGFGGEAGGGKTDLEVGLSLTAHHRSLILRRTNKEAEKLVERFTQVLGSRGGWNGRGTWRLSGGRIIDIGGCEHEDHKQKYKGDPHDLIAFDEVVDFTESQYTFIIGWNRSANEGQRCRVVASFNPPTRPVGMWVMRRWGPWLDPKHSKPAKSGELRWFTTIDGKDTEVDGPGPHMVDGAPVMAKSRTFIRSKLSDNPDLSRTDYDATLAALPQEYRDAYRGGNFQAALKDQPFQCIPTEWVRLAQKRWTPRPRPGVPMCAIGVDASGGSNDPMTIAARHDGWYAPIVEIPAKDLPIERMGSVASGTIISYRRDKAPVVIDMGGGYGGSTYEHLRANDVETLGFKGAEKSVRRTHDKKLGFVNMRTEVFWRFREALDPDQVQGSPISLPPDDHGLLAELTAATFELSHNGLKLEPAEDVARRLGHSPDRAVAVVLAWHAGPTYITDGEEWLAQAKLARNQKYAISRPQTIMGRHNARRR